MYEIILNINFQETRKLNNNDIGDYPSSPLLGFAFMLPGNHLRRRLHILLFEISRTFELIQICFSALTLNCAILSDLINCHVP